MRPARKARGGRIREYETDEQSAFARLRRDARRSPVAFEPGRRRAQRPGMQRRPTVTGLRGRDTSLVPNPGRVTPTNNVSTPALKRRMDV